MDEKSPLNLTRNTIALLLFGCTLFLLAACVSGDSPRAGVGGARVVMELIAFKPEIVEVSPGTTVTWTNKDAAAHTVTSGAVDQQAAGVREMPDGRFDAGEIAKGRTFSFVFKETDTYTYFCSFHPATMQGEVRVK